jgi:hypothetical protein
MAAPSAPSSTLSTTMPDPYLFTRGHTGLEFPSLAYGDPPTEPIEVVATNPTGYRIGDLTVFFDEPAARDIEVAGEDGWHSARDATMVIDEIPIGQEASFFVRIIPPLAGVPRRQNIGLTLDYLLLPPPL